MLLNISIISRSPVFSQGCGFRLVQESTIDLVFTK